MKFECCESKKNVLYTLTFDPHINRLINVKGVHKIRKNEYFSVKQRFQTLEGKMILILQRRNSVKLLTSKVIASMKK